MSEDSFPEFVRRQFPLRPTHPDFERLVEVVNEVERLKADKPVDAKKVYDQVVDTVSVSYLAANRMGMNLPDDFPRGLRDHIRREVHEMMTNAWVEGVFFGIKFAELGGHREDPNDTRNDTSEGTSNG